MTVRFIGDEDIERNLVVIGKFADDITTLRPGAEILKDEMQSRVPKDSYQLHASIDIRKREGRLEVGAGDEGFYGYFLERGTSKMSAQPWLVPALDAARERATDAIARKISTKVDRTWGR